ncbi:bifunctional pantoate--beta-alanine ligase/(d)CMP kinase [Oxynema aestuarii]|uniref:Bifunctional pantoate ligase/cytidylate kinase n=1 Tax=Oxynema aestuarii AP17 TaxID=2064643 RepID=A0A6H1U4N7_9CYAN|nr:bifunctional pantoate--beta-alanine ligase/(d)CMP kinase [Oxynema aestuarii]QIZ72589.1 bifunctional pantoate--beta-alanine ligase/(d)CMP kinase [Oxynema aestuarii AP17]RMH75989.1 MAG: bifunctional pantoate--beta-alanine ligase/(d)CMP kinase [Cyanobacteria bacterium J007]
MVKLFAEIAPLRYELKQYRPRQSIALVPTMGALHRGHLSLIERAREENEIVVVSIFVNPLQFGPNEDFQQYPRTLERDRDICDRAGVDVIFAPNAAEMLGDPNTSSEDTPPAPLRERTVVIPPQSMTRHLCGRSRVGHFQGVATIVTKLLDIVQPDRAYFGQKDAQQLAIVRRLVADLNLPVEIVGCPIVREASGLAMSSRNRYLTDEQKQEAAALYRSLCKARQIFRGGERSAAAIIATVKAELSAIEAIELEYCELVEPTTLKPLETIEESGLLAVAARVGPTRAIDNIMLHDRQAIVAIDGPAGAGKSTVARLVARELGLMYLDTGAMYRAVTWLLRDRDIPLDDEAAVAEVVAEAEIRLQVPDDDPQAPCPVWINDRDVTEAIRSLDVTAHVSAVAALGCVRRYLLKQQQRYGRQGGVVAEGRDIGTHVFPDAELKIFLTASVEERARRRHQDLADRGEGQIGLERLARDLQERDRKDSTREIAPLTKAPDAIEIETDGLSIEQVVRAIVDRYRDRHL